MSDTTEQERKAWRDVNHPPLTHNQLTRLLNDADRADELSNREQSLFDDGHCGCACCQRRRDDAERRKRESMCTTQQRTRDTYSDNLEKNRERSRRKPSRGTLAPKYQRKATNFRYQLLKQGTLVRPDECEVCGAGVDEGIIGTSIVTMYDSYDLDRVPFLPWMCWRCKNQMTMDRNRKAKGMEPYGPFPSVYKRAVP